MCGISGIISKFDRERALRKMLELQKHRGPDHTGFYADKNFAYLGHNRLAIIDLSDSANQPFSDKPGRYSLVFNGEIYNYKELRAEIGSKYDFRTNSDTEVLLAAYIIYGKKCLGKLNGMFAFAIWDSKDKSLFAARDRFGVKPFYYSENSEEFYFASEIKAIRSQKMAGPNEKVWANYFCYGIYGKQEETFFDGIFQLPAGYFLEYRDGIIRKERWYDFEKRIKEGPADHGSESEIEKKYLELLEDSVKLRFRADVEVGFNLSGGVDSSLLLALVNHFYPTRNIRAYTFYTGDKRYDELPWVEKMIAKTGNPLEKVKLSFDEVPELASKMSRFQEEPFGGIPTLAYSKIFQKASKQGVKVLLDGQGMDEQWAGYDYYGRATNVLIQGSENESPFRTGVLDKDFAKLAAKPVYPELFSSEIKNVQYRDLFFTKLPRALRFNDRISMSYSTELREPFLDYRLVEMAFSLPDRMKIRGSVHKYLLREIIRDYIPFEIAEAPKRSLQTPQREWLGGELKDFAETSFQKLEDSEIAGWFDFDRLDQEWRQYRQSDKQNSFYIWQWINAALLAKDY